MLEAAQYADNCFATLTYTDGSLPIGLNGNPSLVPEHVQDWLKRFRKNFPPGHVRYYLAGEYGDESFRPHYHVALFNVPTCVRGRTLRRPGSNRPRWEQCCASCALVGETWGYGDVDLGILEDASAQYVAGYVLKKMTHAQDPRLEGRHPEFSRMSNRPGIGQSAMYEVASELMRFNLDLTQVDVPSTLRHGNKERPLGRYLQQQLRKMVGKDEKAPEAVKQKHAAEMLPLRVAAKNSSTHPSLKSQVILAGTTGRLRLKAKQRLQQRRKYL